MTFSKRETKLLEYLLHSRKSYVTRFELANKLNVSERTIRNDVSSLNHQRNLVAAKRGAGYCLSDRQRVENILGEVPREGWNRNVHLFKQVVDQDPCDFSELAEDLFISEGTLANSIQQLNRSLSAYHFAVKIVRKNNQLFCSGTMVEKKTALRKFLLDEVVDNELDIQVLDVYFEHFNCERLKDDLVTYYQQMGIPVLDYSMLSRLLHLLLVMDKAPKNDSASQHNSPSQPLEEFIEKVEEHQQISLDQTSIEKIKKILFQQKQKQVNEQQAFLSQTILQLMLTEIRENYQLDLSNDQLFKQKFQDHILSLLERCHNRQFIKNPMLMEIKRKFSLIYDISATVVAEVQKQILFPIPEDEIGYIALHLISAIEDLKAEAITIQIVESFSQTITDFLSRMIHANFPETKIIITPKLSFKTVTNQEVDLILSFMPLDIVPVIPVYYLDAKLLGEGQSELMAFIRKIKYEKRFRDFKIKNYFSADYFYPQLQSDNKKQLLQQMCRSLQENQIVDDHFTASVLEREAAAPTSFGDLLAIPHATKKQARQSVIAVATLAKPLQWGTDQVRIVCLFALAPDFKDADRLYSYLLNAVEDTSRLHDLLNASTFKDFQQQLFNKKQEGNLHD